MTHNTVVLVIDFFPLTFPSNPKSNVFTFPHGYFWVGSSVICSHIGICIFQNLSGFISSQVRSTYNSIYMGHFAIFHFVSKDHLCVQTHEIACRAFVWITAIHKSRNIRNNPYNSCATFWIVQLHPILKKKTKNNKIIEGRQVSPS